MTDQQPKNQDRPVSGKVPANLESKTSKPQDQSDVSKLTADEQMALFENDLKENDWGHQPC